MFDLLVKGKYILTMNDKLEIIQDGFVAVKDGKIQAIGKGPEAPAAKEIMDTGNSIIMPGLINTHTHAAMAYFRGLADDLPLKTWLNDHIWPAEKKYLNPNFVRISSELAILEMIKSGTTCFNDMYFFEEITGEVAEKAGIRAMLGEAILDFPTPSSKTPQDTIDRTISQADQFKNSELVKIAVAPHAIYTCSKEYLEKAAQVAKEKNLLVHIHLSETKQEILEAKEKHGKSPVKYLDELGLFENKTIAAHGVWLDDDDIDILFKKKVAIGHCPISNMKLASGIMPLTKVLKKDITVGLATDSAASNNTLDLFSEMRISALIHKVTGNDPSLAKASEIINMATMGGAKALGLEEKIGSLEVGKSADMITINLDRPHLSPIYDVYSHLVYCTCQNDVDNVIINGKVVMKNGETKTLEESNILKKISKYIS